MRESSGSKKIKTAENLLKQRIGEIATHTWVAPADRRLPVNELYSALLDDYRNNGLASLEGARQRWERNAEENEKPEPGRLQQLFGDIRAVNVTTDTLKRYVAECLEQKLSNGTINRDIAALRRAFRIAFKAGKIQKVPFFPHLNESPSTGICRGNRLFEAKEAKELWLRAMLATAYTFGFRKRELLNLKVAQVDLMEHTIRLNAGEIGRGPTVKMTQDVFTLLSACIADKKPGDFVFSSADGSPIFTSARDGKS